MGLSIGNDAAKAIADGNVLVTLSKFEPSPMHFPDSFPEPRKKPEVKQVPMPKPEVPVRREKKFEPSK
jgi:hypothetical protein